MIVTCYVGGCGWSERDPSIVWLYAKAEQHRIDAHDWVKRGRVHRLELEEHEDEQIDQLLGHWKQERALEKARNVRLPGLNQT
jgi:hypothetical protein